jgi:aryl-alcohol dehydrogenase-like predicted oxidoreductase
MERRAIGGLSVSVIGLGCNNFGQRFGRDQSEEVVQAALEAGINYFDTSDNYAAGASEECLGYALRNHREEAVVATKYDGAPQAARESCLASLSRLQMDYIDLFQIHHPYTEAPVGETLDALGALVDEGLVREIGCSNFSVPQLREAAAAGYSTAQFSSVQNDHNLLNRKHEFDVIPECQAAGIAFNSYFPLYHGLLTGKFRRGEVPPEATRLGQASEARKTAVFTDANFSVVEALDELAQRYGRRVLDIALARPLHIPGVTAVIAGATWPDQVRANAVAGSWQLDPALCEQIDAIAIARPDAADTPSAARGIK